MVEQATRQTNQITILSAFNGTLEKTATSFVPFLVTQATRGARFDSSHAHKGHDEWGTLHVLKLVKLASCPHSMKGKHMLITPQEVRNAQISTRFFGTGYDMEETDQLLDNCEQTIEAVGMHLVEMQAMMLKLTHLLEAHNIPIPQTI